MENPRILLITPPLTQLNTPYPATAYLTGFLKQRGFNVQQADLGIELVLKLFSEEGFDQLFARAGNFSGQISENSRRILALQKEYKKTVKPVISFLQNADSTIAHRICNGNFLPEASRFDQVEDTDWAFGSLGIQDKARYLATLYLEDVGDLIIETISPHFGFSRYAESLALTASSFDKLHHELQLPNSLLDAQLLQELEKKIKAARPDLIGFTVPFPGNLYGALKCGQYIKQNYPEIKVMMGGGYPNTELRNLTDSRVFEFVDFITLDDGEGPFLRLIEYLQGKRELNFLQRTYLLNNDKVDFVNGCVEKDFPHHEVGTPDYEGLPLHKYLSVIDVLNPMHRLWSDGRWNKLTIAHGCYWKRCSFCDVTLDYIRRYETAPAAMLCDRIEQIIGQTGQTGFHFVDEAAPPLALRDLAIEILKRDLNITWWANIRFEKTFSADLCRLLAAAGCIAVSGGLEVASDRLLALMEKGVTIEQVAQVTNSFTGGGIMVHAYLMYGFPTQTAQETIDSLEIVRQLFDAGIVQSGYWHRFAMTAHSPVGKNPEKYQVIKTGPEHLGFAENDLWHKDPGGADHPLFSDGLKKALYNYMHGIGFEYPLQQWFDHKPKGTSLPKDLISRLLQSKSKIDKDTGRIKLLWLGNLPEITLEFVMRKGRQQQRARLVFYEKMEDLELFTSEKEGIWLKKIFPSILPSSPTLLSLPEIEDDFKADTGLNFDQFLTGNVWTTLRKKGLLLLRF